MKFKFFDVWGAGVGRKVKKWWRR